MIGESRLHASSASPPSLLSKLPAKRGMSLSMRIASMVALVIVITVGLISFLNYSNYHKNHHEFTQSRYLVLANDIKQTIEYSLNLGLPLGQLEQAQRLLDEIKLRMPSILFIRVFNDQRTIAFATEPALIGQSIAPTWFDIIDRTGKDAHWHGEDDAAYLVAVPLVNNFDVKVGAVVVGYSRAKFDAQSTFMGQRLMMDTLGVTVVTLLLMLVGIRLIMREIEPGMAQVEQSLDRFLDDPNAPLPAVTAAGSTLEHDITEFEQASRQALIAIETVATDQKTAQS